VKIKKNPGKYSKTSKAKAIIGICAGILGLAAGIIIVALIFG